MRFPAPASLAAVFMIAACGDSPGAGSADAGTSQDVDVREPVDAAEDSRVIRPDVASPDVAPDTQDTSSDIAAEVSQNLPPVAAAGEDLAGLAGRPVTFDGTGSSDPDGTIVRYEWQTGDGATLSGAEPTYTYRSAGIYVATLTVTDDGGLSASDSITIDLVEPNNPPVAIIRREFSGPVVETIEYRFSATDSSDDVAITRYEWDLGVADTDPVEGEILDAIWPEWGTYDLTLTVTDTDGETDIEIRSIDVLAPPTAVIEGPREVIAGEEVVFLGTSSFDRDNEEPNAIVGYAWAWGDGTPISEGPFPRHTWMEPGDYDIELTVTDTDELTHSTGLKLRVLPVPNVEPTAVIRVDREPAGAVSTTIAGCQEITFSAADSVDPDDPDGPVSWEWDFGDGTSLPGETVTRAYRTTGTFVVTLIVTDSEGATDTATFEVIVENTPPTASFVVAPLPVPLGSLASFDASASTDCEGDIARYRWDFGNSIVGSSTSPLTNHTYGAAGIFNVTLEVEDADGARASQTRVVEVNEVVVPPSYSGSWNLAAPVALSCASGSVSMSFSRFVLDDRNPVISASSASSPQPGTMTGTWTSGTVFAVDRIVPPEFPSLGGCREEYRLTGTVLSATSIEYVFETLYVVVPGIFGSCGDCPVVPRRWTGTMTR